MDTRDSVIEIIHGALRSLPEHLGVRVASWCLLLHAPCY